MDLDFNGGPIGGAKRDGGKIHGVLGHQLTWLDPIRLIRWAIDTDRLHLWDTGLLSCRLRTHGRLLMHINPAFILYETEHWVLNHHQTSKLPGYLMLGAKSPVDALAEMPEAALAELGGLLAKTQRVMEAQLRPKWLYISRYGHMPGLALHFHFIPVYDWVEQAFWRDERYRVLQTLGTQELAQTLTDGAELTLFVWREFGESDTPPVIQGEPVGQVIERLRLAFDLPA